jgi:hypothetical protein
MNKEENKLGGLKNKFDEAQKYGLNLQKEGINIVKHAEKGKEIINFIENNNSLINEPYIQGWVVGSGDLIPAHPPDNLGEISKYSMVLGTSSATATAYFYSPGTNLLNFDKKPTIDFLKDYDVEMDELDGYLKSFSDEFKDIGDLVAMRKGAWEVFNSAIETNVAMASHSMREILSKVIAKLSDNKKVMESEWWKPSEDKKTPTLRQRLRYLLFGPKKEGKNLEIVSNAVEKSFEADDKLKKVAHGSKGLREEVKKAMRTTEYALLAIFRARKIAEKK